MKNPSPYIGITGFKTKEEIIKTANAFKENYEKCRAYKSPHEPMFGFLCSNKRLEDKLSEGTQSPAFIQLKELIDYAVDADSLKKCIPMIHYHTENAGKTSGFSAPIEQSSPGKEKLADEIKEVFERIYDKCKAVQLNMTWPAIEQVEKIKKEFPDMQIVFQLNKYALKDAGIEAVVKRTKEYEKFVDYVLIDPSGGLGAEFDLEKSTELMTAIENEMKNKTIGIAGGLDGENVKEKVVTITKKIKHSYFCIDAQGRLRTENKNEISIEKTYKYVAEALRAFSQRPAQQR